MEPFNAINEKNASKGGGKMLTGENDSTRSDG